MFPCGVLRRQYKVSGLAVSVIVSLQPLTTVDALQDGFNTAWVEDELDPVEVSREETLDTFTNPVHGSRLGISTAPRLRMLWSAHMGHIL